jgi:mono/diheme cytochrome c family protein/glucose/arabinose dehydrogenase
MKDSRLTTAWGLLALCAGAAVVLALSSSPQPAAKDPAHDGQASHADDKVPVLSPVDSHKAFQIQDGFAISLVAAEPEVEAPVCGAFDEAGRLWIVEMRTYMPNVEGKGELEGRNRILILEDRDNDGVREHVTVFADNMVLPRGVAPCHGGALVIEPPNLLFMRDTDGDGRADERRVLIDGFAGRDNPEHAGNGLVYGIDGWWELSQHGIRFQFDGKEFKTQRTPGHGQWGLTRDDHGRLYYTPNSNPLLVDLFPKQYGARPGTGGGISGLGESIGRDGETWPAIPTPTVNRGYREGTLRADGTLTSVTAACGPVIVRTGVLGDGYRDNAFICEPAGQLVKRLVISQRDDSFDAANVVRNGEFLRSTDERFRPVNALIGPDGGLYIFDMYRGLIQHRMFLTPHLKEITINRGMEAPVNCGRIWRIAPTGTQIAMPFDRFPAKMTSAELVAAIASREGWWRDTAQRLLIERRATDAADLLRSLAYDTNQDESARATALWTIQGLGLITSEDLARTFSEERPLLSIHVLRIAELSPSVEVFDKLISLGLASRHEPLRIQTAISAYVLPSEMRVPIAANIYSRFGDRRMIRAALRTTIPDIELAVLDELLENRKWPANGSDRAVLRELADIVMNKGDEARTQLATLAAEMATSGDERSADLVDRFKSRLRIDSDDPGTLKLTAVPAKWQAAVDAQVSGADVMRKCLDRFEWPGRSVPVRKRVVRDLTSVEWDLFNQGKKIYATTCVACHQAEGQGSPGLAPPLVDSPIANGPGGRMTRVLLHGLEGGYMPGGAGSWGVMPIPAIHESGQLAAVITYVRRSWGNTGDPVTPASVAAVRAKTHDRTKPWNRDELNGVRE